MKDMILSLNAGASSLRFGLFTHRDGRLVESVRGLAGDLAGKARLDAWEAGGRHVFSDGWTPSPGAPDHAGALTRILAWLEQRAEVPITAIAHRIVHGGERARAAVLTPDLAAELDELARLAPQHQAVGLALHRQARSLRPQATHIACFDTAFHSGMPSTARAFALPQELTSRGIRRYGFHGLSYAHTLRQLRKTDPDLATGRIIVAHLGAGASLCAMDAGASIDTTMGFSALDGLVMATRSGALDPCVILHLLKHEGMTADEVEDLLYRRSGLLGVSGISGDLQELMTQTSESAKAAVELFVYRAAQGVGAMAATLRGVDGLVFTGGVGEHNAEVRARICRRLDWLGVEIDAQANAGEGERRIDAPTSGVSVWVIPADEESEMAHEAADLLWPQARADARASAQPAAWQADRVDALLDEALEGSVPASDPPSLVRPHQAEDQGAAGRGRG